MLSSTFLDQHGQPSFNLLQNRRLHASAVRFYVFDLLFWQGRSLLAAPLRTRRDFLRLALKQVQSPVLMSDSLEAPLGDLIAAARKTNLEGLVAKSRESRYEPGKRSGAWLKLRFNLDQELVIGGYLPGPRGFDALLAGYYEQGRLIFAGKIRNGFRQAGSKERVFARFKGLGSARCPFDNLPEPANARRGMALTAEAMKLCCWLKPELVAQVGIREWTPDRHLRHSTFLGIRDDKPARQVVFERG